MVSTADTGEAFIEHYGVKGQKWGVRRAKRQLGKKVKRLLVNQLKIYQTQNFVLLLIV